MNQAEPAPLVILAGGGSLPVEVADAAKASGRRVLAISLAGEANLEDFSSDIDTARVEWGKIGGMLKTMRDFGARDVVLIGSISKRPDHKSLSLDWGAVQLLPQLLSMLFSGGDQSLLDKAAKILSDQGFTLVGAHEVAPTLVASEGLLAGPKPTDAALADATRAAHGAWTAGHLDMGQGAVSILSRLAAMEGAEGTDGLLLRVGEMVRHSRLSHKPKTGSLAKCLRPGQDLRLDMPTIGPRTIENAADAGLACVVVEAHGVLVTQQTDTFALCKKRGVSLLGRPRSYFVPENRTDERA